MNQDLTYINLDLSSAKLYVFINDSFVNNKDLSSQIRFEIILVNKIAGDNKFTIHENLIYWSLTKSKRVTRIILASEIYSMIAGIDISFTINSIFKIIIEQLNLSAIPTIICTDLFLLYKYLIKLSTTKEKHFMINIIAICQLYKCQKLFKI